MTPLTINTAVTGNKLFRILNKVATITLLMVNGTDSTRNMASLASVSVHILHLIVGQQIGSIIIIVTVATSDETSFLVLDFRMTVAAGTGLF